MSTIVEMRQELGSLAEKMTALNNRISKEQRDFTQQEKETWERMEREALRLDGQIARDEAQEKREADLAKTAFHNG